MKISHDKKVDTILVSTTAYHVGARLHVMQNRLTISKRDILSIFHGVTKLIAETDPRYASVFINYQTLYIAFTKMQEENKILKNKLKIYEKIHN